MDESLLSKHDSGSSSNSGTTTPRTTASSFRRRSDAIAYGSPYQKAAALVDLAEDGVGLPEQILNGSNFQSAAKFAWSFILSFLTICLVGVVYWDIANLLHGLEYPRLVERDDCHDREYYFLGQLPYLSGIDSLIYEGITLIILAVHTFFPVTYEGRIYWKNSSNGLKVFFLLVLIADLFIYGLYLSPVGFAYLPFRMAPYIRVVFFILNIRELRQTTVILAGMLRTYVNVLALGLLFLLFSSWLAYVIFEDTHAGQEIFPSYGTTLYKMLILFTTSNNPDVWIPAYKASRWYCLFFILYMLLGVYFVTNLILAVVYDSFKGQLAKQVAEMDSMRKRNLAKAFSLIDKNGNELKKIVSEMFLQKQKAAFCKEAIQQRGYLDKEQCIRLFEELTRYRTLPKISREEFELIFDELDDSHDFKINLDEFTDICNAISVRFQREDTPSWLENCPNVYHSLFSEKLKTFVRDPKFGYLIAFILLLNLVAVVIETTLDIENSTAQAVWQGVEFVFGWIYVVEMALKVYSFGFENYWKDGQNRFDFVITWIIVIGETATFVSPNGLTFLSNGEWIRYLLLARMLRLIRLLMHVRQYRAFVATFLTLVPSLMPYLGIIFCTMCVYCSLGVQIFGGIVNAGNPELERTVLADDNYYLFNFNDYPNGMVTLFNLLVMNNWQDWMQGYKELTGSSWTIVYFVSFYLITVLLLLNLVVAFVLEAFFAEMELENSEKGEVQEEESQGKDRRRRSAGSKSRSQRVDILLHHMLSSELGEAQSTDS